MVPRNRMEPIVLMDIYVLLHGRSDTKEILDTGMRTAGRGKETMGETTQKARRTREEGEKKKSSSRRG